MIPQDWVNVNTSPKRYNWGAIVEGVVCVIGLLGVIVAGFVVAYYKNI